MFDFARKVTYDKLPLILFANVDLLSFDPPYSLSPDDGNFVLFTAISIMIGSGIVSVSLSRYLCLDKAIKQHFIELLMIDLDQIGADWQLASAHAKSTVAGKTPKELEEIQRCPCCFRAIITEPIQVFSNSKELEVLGFAYPLYFKFLQYSMILLLFQVCSYNIPELFNAISLNHQLCQTASNTDNSAICGNFLLKLASLSHSVTTLEKVTRLCSFLIQMFLLIYIRQKMSNTLNYYGERRTVISNYAILLKDLPQVTNIKSRIKRLFTEYYSSVQTTEEIILIGSLEEYYQLKAKKNKLIKQKMKLISQPVVDQQLLQKIEFQLARAEDEIDTEVQKTISLTKKDQLLCEKVIVIVPTQHQQQTIIREFSQYSHKTQKLNKLKDIFGTDDVNRIRIQASPEPEEIIWQHINIPRRKRRIKQILGWIFTALFMALLTAVFYFILKVKSEAVSKYIQENEENADSESASRYRATAGALVYIYIFVIVLLNKFVISKFLHLISDFEKHPTHYKEEYYFSLKYTMTLFLTTAVITILVEDFTLHNIYHEKYGLIEEETIMYLVSSFFVPLLWLINPLQIYRQIKRSRNYGSKILTQREANELMMDEPASLGKLFAETIETIWFTYMYSTVIPVGGLLVLAGFSVNYWIVKFNILKRSSIYHQVSGKFILMALNLLDFSLVMKPIGEMLFDSELREGLTIESLVSLGIGIVYCLLPIQAILEQVHKEDFLLEEKTYQQAKHQFTTNYHMLHPIYSLQKIYVEKETQRLKLYELKGLPEQRRPTKKLAVNIELALMRRSSQFKLQPHLPQKLQDKIEEKVQRSSMQEDVSMGQGNAGSIC